MQTLKIIRRRITSINGTSKVIGAMKLMATSKIRKAREGVLNARLYADTLRELALQVANKGGEVTHPAFILRPKVKKAIILVITPERGFCGALSENMVRQISNFLDVMRDRNIEVSTWVIGSKGAKSFVKRGIKFRRIDITARDGLEGEKIRELGRELLEIYLSGECDQIILAYNRLKSILVQQVTMDMFLPVWARKGEGPVLKDKIDFIYEPGKEVLLEKILKDTLIANLYHVLLEGKASEVAARMVSMDKAQKNAHDMMEKLGREYNKVRQRVITNELLDIVGGAKAMQS